jgi:hypothetical protein
MIVIACAHMAVPTLLQSVPMHLQKGQHLARKTA